MPKLVRSEGIKRTERRWRRDIAMNARRQMRGTGISDKRLKIGGRRG